MKDVRPQPPGDAAHLESARRLNGCFGWVWQSQDHAGGQGHHPREHCHQVNQVLLLAVCLQQRCRA